MNSKKENIVEGICFLILVGLLICLIFTYENRINRFIKEVNGLEKRIEILEKIESDKNNVVIPDDVLLWAYKNSNIAIPKRLVRKIVEESLKNDYGLMILAIIAEESDFNPFAYSYKNARGLTQIIDKYWFKELKENEIIIHRFELYDYKKNIKACNYILDKHYKRYGDWEKVLFRYNRSNKYVKNVLRNYNDLKEIKQES